MNKSIEILVTQEGEKVLLYVKRSKNLDQQTGLELVKKLFTNKTKEDIETVLKTLPKK